jgi:hypothetical protein
MTLEAIANAVLVSVTLYDELPFRCVRSGGVWEVFQIYKGEVIPCPWVAPTDEEIHRLVTMALRCPDDVVTVA